MKNKIIIIGICVSIIISVWWISNVPPKEIVGKTQWLIDGDTKNEFPIFLLHYEWDGVEENHPTWKIFPHKGKWWVVDLRTMMSIDYEIKSEDDYQNRIEKHRHEFTYNWIENRKFKPKASRFEAVMTTFGFNMIFRTEQHAFFDILEDTKDFKGGRHYPDEPELAEKKHPKYSLLANKSADEFNSFLEKRCEQYTDSKERGSCQVNTSKEWLNTYGKDYEEIPSRYISGNDLAITFITGGAKTP